MIHDDSRDFCEDSLRPMRTTQQVQFRCLSDEPGAAASFWRGAMGDGMICAGKSCLTLESAARLYAINSSACKAAKVGG